MLLADYRKRICMTQQELSKILKIKRSTLSMWETGKTRPSIDTLKKLAEVLQVSVEEILNCF